MHPCIVHSWKAAIVITRGLRPAGLSCVINLKEIEYDIKYILNIKFMNVISIFL